MNFFDKNWRVGMKRSDVGSCQSCKMMTNRNTKSNLDPLSGARPEDAAGPRMSGMRKFVGWLCSSGIQTRK